MASLWDQAYAKLDPADKLVLDCFDKRIDVLGELLVVVEQKRDEATKKRWKIKKPNGGVIILRDVFSKMSDCINRFVQIGDVAVQYDPVHASLPWAGVRFLLQVIVSDSESLAAVIEGVDLSSRIITRYAIFEAQYLDGPQTPALELVCKDLVELYSSALLFLVKAKKYYDDKTVVRLLKSVVKPTKTELEGFVATVATREAAVHRDASMISRQEQKDASERMMKLYDMFNNLEQPIMLFQAQLSTLQDSLTQKQRKRLFTWLSSLSHIEQHKAARQGILDGSGQWLLDNQTYKSWLSSSSPGTLWLHGIPGCGKTKLASIVIESLQKALLGSNNQTTSVAYFYCARNTAEPLRAKPGEVLRSILRQLGASKIEQSVHECLTQEFEAQFDAADVDGSNPPALSIDETTRLLQQVLSSQPAIIIIDAMDECDPEERYELFDALRRLVEEADQVVKLLVTSRDDTDIMLEYRGSETVYVRAEDNGPDIRRYIEKEVASVIEKRRLLRGDVDDRLRDDIIQRLTLDAHGMFRWVSLSLTNLCSSRMKTADDVRRALGRLPKTLAELYHDIHEIIRDSEYGTRDLAYAIIKWLLCCLSPLSTEAMRLLASRHLSEESFPTVERVLDVCCNLVVLSENSKEFRFAHLSVREYFENLSDFNTADAHWFATEELLSYLHNQQISSKKDFRHSDGSDQDIRDNQMTTMAYAVFNWPAHYELSNPTTRDQTDLVEYLDSFLGTDETPVKFEQCIRWIRHEYWILHNKLFASRSATLWDSTMRRSDDKHTSIFLIVALGMTERLRKRDKSIDLQGSITNERKRTLIEVAADFGHESVVAFLLQELQWSDGELGRALLFGAQKSRIEVMQLLIDAGANLEYCNRDENTALSLAAEDNNEKAVRFLLSRGADIEHRNLKGKTPLHLTAEWGHNETLKIFIKAGAKLSTLERLKQRTPLIATAQYNNVESARILLDAQAGINDVNEKGESALWTAAAAGNFAVARLLLDRGANHNRPDKQGVTPLARAAASNSFVILHMLDEYEASRSMQHVKGHTLLTYAVSMSTGVELVETLLSWGHDVNERGANNATPLHFACIAGNFALVDYILSHEDVDINAQDRFGRTPLFYAIESRTQWVVTRLLEENKLDPNLKDHSGTPALFWAAKKRSDESMLYFLVTSKSINHNIRNKSGRTLIQYVLAEGLSTVFEDLLYGLERRLPTGPDGSGWWDIGKKEPLDLVSADSFGWTPLMLAFSSMAHNKTALRRVLGTLMFVLGPSINSFKDSVGRNALSLAVLQGNADAVEDLLWATGIDRNCQDEYGFTPLLYAAALGRSDIILQLAADQLVDLDATDFGGRSAGDIAFDNGHKAIGIILENLNRISEGFQPVSMRAMSL